MMFYPRNLCILVGLAVSTCWTATAEAANPVGCLPEGTVDPNQDYFPDKVSPDDSKLWTVTYHNTYKIATNLVHNASYLLYQCGSEVPVFQEDEYAGVLEIPLKDVGITVTPMIAFMEQLNSLDKIGSYFTEVEYISSPCFKANVEAGDVLTLENTLANTGAGAGSDLTDVEVVPGLVVFTDGFDSLTFVDQKVLFSSYKEKTSKAIFEWAKFYSVFFNQEAQANSVTEAAAARFDCVAEIAASETADGPKPTVLWGSYSSYCEGWNLGDCTEGNYYCEMADRCDAELWVDAKGTIESDACGNLLTTEEFVAYGKDAEYWFYPTHFDPWDDTYKNNKELLDTMKSVQDKQVFDYQGSGSNAWFQERVAMYYDVLQDFCHTVGTAPQLNRPTWFRNVFTESVGSPGVCVEGQSVDNLPFAFDGQCEMSDPASDAASGTHNSLLVIVGLAVLGLVALN